MALERGPQHLPVLPEEVMGILNVQPGGRVLDGTLGLAGHAARLAEAAAPDGVLVGLDRDPDALGEASKRLASVPIEVHLVHSPFSEPSAALQQAGLQQIDAILLDLGVSSLQLDTPQRGFSFRAEAPLDMRMDPTSGAATAADLVNTLPESHLADIIWRYGEERASRAIAKRVAEARSRKTIETTGELAELVRGAVRGRSRMDKATRTFQALRIEVNDEIGELERALERCPELLAPGGRMAVISFHSLEDRTVKNRFRELERSGDFRRLNRKVITASEQERSSNPRSRSAKLRGIERLEG